jgi:ankyrin repeat protein
MNNIETSNLLIFASENDVVESIKELIFKKGADVNAKDKYGCTLLHIACINGNYECAKLLIEAGADINAKNFDNVTPLNLARECNHPKIVALLLWAILRKKVRIVVICNYWDEIVYCLLKELKNIVINSCLYLN